ncbi:MAG: divergent polysaccharide deacetylase family protein [Candidatus Omnitrophica bacterium]|nr:divergent polysaccharide deacetylase family protein [Candidatus Omnitrophota bacterium]MDD4013334.1 divergent polysaccharide deacetylase family protein [Candidatus Omnitrophota bacterium]
MKSRAIIILTALFGVFLLVWGRSCSGGIGDDPSTAETEILSVLSSRGMNEDALISRQEDYHNNNGKRGKTVVYIFTAPEGFNAEGIERSFKISLKKTHGVSYCGKVFVPSEKGGAGGADKYTFCKAKEPILEIHIKRPVKTDIPREQPTMAAAGAEVPRGAGRLAIVIDDIGYTDKNLEAIAGIGVPITLAVLPDTPKAKESADLAVSRGLEVILHLPMEPESSSEKLEKNTVKVSMPSEEVKRIVADALGKVPWASGVSNHQGSKATSSESTMKALMSELNARGMFFLDSMTTSRSVSGKAAEATGVKMVKRDIFLDNSNDEVHIAGQLDKASKMVLEGKDIIAIGHDRAATIKVLAHKVPSMKKRGVRFVGLSSMVEVQ